VSRFFVNKEAVKGNRIYITGDEAHHIVDVMRLKTLDKVITFDGTGREYAGFIRKTGRKSVEVEVVETRMPLARSGARITLIQAIPKKEKMDYIVEKATELGVHSIIPIITKRTIPDWDSEKKRANAERWRKIAREAAKQCGRRDIPLVGEVSEFISAVKGAGDCDLCLMAALSDEAVKLKDALASFKGGSLAIAVGPEGDFTPEEIKAARAARFKSVSLGSRVLKSDTAGLAMLAVLNYEFSD
jgi:16S rRNA (uracil1498-N3)-methyltransferase